MELEWWEREGYEVDSVKQSLKDMGIYVDGVKEEDIDIEKIDFEKEYKIAFTPLMRKILKLNVKIGDKEVSSYNALFANRPEDEMVSNYKMIQRITKLIDTHSVELFPFKNIKEILESL